MVMYDLHSYWVRKDLLKYNPYRFEPFLGYMTHNGMSFVAYLFSINYFTFINLLDMVNVKSLVWSFFPTT